MLVSPTTPTTAFPIGERADDPMAMYLADLYTIPSDLAGNAAISVPCGLAPEDGLPVGLQIMAPALADDRTYRVAAAVEAAFEQRWGGPLLAQAKGLAWPGSRRRRAMTELAQLVPYDEAVARYEPVIGLETHVELGTATKMFCGCPTTFGLPPNSAVCPVCLGLPGSLPVANRAAIEYTIRIGLALNCSIASWCRFARKNYFYPDMPKDFQISQYDEPLCTDGWLDVAVEGQIVPRRHRARAPGGRHRQVAAHGRRDRAGSMAPTTRWSTTTGQASRWSRSSPSRSPARAHSRQSSPASTSPSCATCCALCSVSDVRMEEGSLRCDVNTSLAPRGAAEWGTRTETKNVNSLRSVERAVRFEIERQAALLDAGRRIVQETRHFHEDTGTTTAGRSKEEAQDYRYFPEPDLVPIAPDSDWVEEIRAGLPEFPAAQTGKAPSRMGPNRPGHDCS